MKYTIYTLIVIVLLVLIMYSTFNFKIFIGILLFQVKFFLVNLKNWPISYLKKVMMIRAKKTKKKN